MRKWYHIYDWQLNTLGAVLQIKIFSKVTVTTVADKTILMSRLQGLSSQRDKNEETCNDSIITITIKSKVLCKKIQIQTKNRGTRKQNKNKKNNGLDSKKLSQDRKHFLKKNQICEVFC